ncbi:transcriptional regulator [Thermosipho melanesiensis]|uniref:Transcriptional regulator n=2 Tax=Thermosipho melanesiensis TaxID=46541 RepID=A0ABM6GDS6_9BACT|nr:transcriptional regulator [Thermosipho melanesiensis]ABR30605.1 putative transcriptional regulator [Thermosipho melanesiensis BI429]APT73746.1 transcriptional regulator [Thermosipho melanesiensis]OOC35686.1 transcriptional regulator [Thermosipho melanesiensis]OOC38985.1 transcriptional regulator [Thermosipho melanesiensis]OOC39133.1 transcriptional regulator [Thermosipho melanesiensis]
MYEILKIISSPQLFEVLNFLRNNPNKNPSSIARALGFHTFTVQRYLEVLERFGIVKAKVEKKVGRPSKKYTYVGGNITIDFDDILSMFDLKNKKVREKKKSLRYSYDLKGEKINGVVDIERITKLSDMEGKVLFLIPPFDSEGIQVEKIIEKVKFSEFDILSSLKKLISLEIIEVVE